MAKPRRFTPPANVSPQAAGAGARVPRGPAPPSGSAGVPAAKPLVRQPTGATPAAPTAADTATYQALLAGLLEFVWGKGQPDIQRQLQGANAKTLAPIIGHITFALVQQGADQGQQAGKQFTTNMLLGVATEMIETLERMAAAMNIQFDPKAIGLQALVQTLTDYAESLPQGSSAQQDAQQALRELGQQNLNDAASTVQQIGQSQGADPFGQKPPGGPGNGTSPSARAAPAGLMGAAA